MPNEQDYELIPTPNPHTHLFIVLRKLNTYQSRSPFFISVHAYCSTLRKILPLLIKREERVLGGETQQAEGLGRAVGLMAFGMGVGWSDCITAF